MRSLRQGMTDYIAMKRAMGFIFGDQEYALIGFCNFMESSKHKFITTEFAKTWAQGSKASPGWMEAKKLSVLRGFAVYWKTIEPKTEVWSENLWPMRYQRVAPYIYADKEVQKILRACLSLEPQDSIRARMFYTLFGLVAACGLRLSEAINLTLDDADLGAGIITIRRAKFNTIRAIPVHESTLRQLKEYKLLRDKLHGRSSLPFFFITHHDTRVTLTTAEWTFDKVALACGVRTKPRNGPRIHDLRHTFVVRTLEEWYRQGKDVEALLPVLSTYVGHAQPGSTYWYMTITPDLMALASERRDRYMGGLS